MTTTEGGVLFSHYTHDKEEEQRRRDLNLGVLCCAKERNVSSTAAKTAFGKGILRCGGPRSTASGARGKV